MAHPDRHHPANIVQPGWVDSDMDPASGAENIDDGNYV
jgi:hypothetical protein